MHATTADIAPDHAAGRRDLVDFVDVNDSELCPINVAIGFMHQLAHQIFHVATDVTGLAELCRIRLHERHLDQIGDVFDQIRFSDSSRADENDILLGIFRLGCAIRPLLLQLPDVIDVVVVIADCNRENLLRFVLFDHKTIEMRFDVAWQKMKVEVLCLFRWAFLIGSRLDRVRLGERGKRNPVAKIRFHELGELRFQFFR